MPSITKRGPYQYQARIRRRGYPTITKTFESKADAASWAREMESEMDRGVFISRAESEKTTLKEAFERYLREVTVTKKGAKREETRIKQWLQRDLAQRYLASIRGCDIASFRDARLKDVSANTVRLELAVLSHLFTIARKEWGMENLHNPVQNIRKPKPSPGRDRRFVDGEEAKLLAKATEPLRSIITLALETAMRRSEISGLCWEDVDFKARKVKLVETKNGDAREVPLSIKAIDVLKQFPRNITGTVFGEKEIIAEMISHEFPKLCQSLKIENLRFHDLRHEATTRLFERGLNIMEVRLITGHKTLVMLQRYTHLKAEDLAKKLN